MFKNIKKFGIDRNDRKIIIHNKNKKKLYKNKRERNKKINIMMKYETGLLSKCKYLDCIISQNGKYTKAVKN